MSYTVILAKTAQKQFLCLSTEMQDILRVLVITIAHRREVYR